MTAMDQMISRIASAVLDRLQAPAKEERIPLGVSNRHLHVSEADLKTLFGDSAELDVWKPLRQPGQYASSRTVLAAGPKGSLCGVRILGPCRTSTQLELSATDCRSVGIPAVLRESGSVAGTPGITLVGPCGSVVLKEGVIVAMRHMHMTPDLAQCLGVQDKQRVSVKFDGPREAILGGIVVRVSDQFLPELHLDTDEVNALMVTRDSIGVEDILVT